MCYLLEYGASVGLEENLGREVIIRVVIVYVRWDGGVTQRVSRCCDVDCYDSTIYCCILFHSFRELLAPVFGLEVSISNDSILVNVGTSVVVEMIMCRKL